MTPKDVVNKSVQSVKSFRAVWIVGMPACLGWHFGQLALALRLASACAQFLAVERRGQPKRGVV